MTWSPSAEYLVIARIDNIVNATEQEKQYNTALTHAFNRKPYMNASSISNIVCNVRAQLGMPRLAGNILKLCVEEVQKLFFVQEKMQANSTAKKERVYKPVFSLLVS